MNNILIFAVLAVICVMTMAGPTKREFKIRGGVRKLEGDDISDAEEALEFSLNKLAGDEKGPHYKLGKVNSATKQLVSGSLYKINADIIDSDENTKNCDVKIWSQPWLDDGYEITFECQGDEVLVRKHSA